MIRARRFPFGAACIFAGLLVCLAAGCCTLRTKDNPQVQVKQLAKSSVSWNGAPLPAYPAGDPEITILRIVIPPGQTLASHEHPVINAGVLLRGELTVKAEDGKILHLRAGEAITEVVGTWHAGKNEGPGEAEIIVFYAGAKGAPITVHKPD